MPSGQFIVRLPPALHGALRERAREQGVSLNQLVVALLAGGIGFTMED
jgi:predicted HicB family RNase H-like nuclease